jgi:hypothetical protein
MPQASLLPLSTALAVVLPLPVASSCTVTSWQMATGATLSITVTMDRGAGAGVAVHVWQMATGLTLSSTVTTVVQVLTLPFTSVTVSVSVLAPTSEQTNAVWLKAKLAMAQLSELPLLTRVLWLCCRFRWHPTARSRSGKAQLG